MKRILCNLFICLIISITLGCGGEVYYTDLNSGYYLPADDVRYKDGDDGIGLIDAAAFAIGQNTSINVKQHPGNFADQPGREVFNYYIIPLKTKPNKASDKNFHGPFDLSEFEQKRGRLRCRIGFYYYF